MRLRNEQIRLGLPDLPDDRLVDREIPTHDALRRRRQAQLRCDLCESLLSLTYGSVDDLLARVHWYVRDRLRHHEGVEEHDTGAAAPRHRGRFRRRELLGSEWAGHYHQDELPPSCAHCSTWMLRRYSTSRSIIESTTARSCASFAFALS
jgi:hypothetical protein